MEKTEILKKRIENLPKNLKDFVLKGEWDNTLGKILGTYSLEEYQKNIISNEVLLILLMATPYTDLQKNISEQADVDLNIAGWISESVQEQILEPIANDVVEELDSEEETPTFIDNSFEELVLNQVRGMQPAKGDGERDTIYEERIRQEKGRVPDNLPTGESEIKIENQEDKKREERKIQTPNYSGQDPYREPLE